MLLVFVICVVDQRATNVIRSLSGRNDVGAVRPCERCAPQSGTLANRRPSRKRRISVAGRPITSSGLRCRAHGLQSIKVVGRALQLAQFVLPSYHLDAFFTPAPARVTPQSRQGEQFSNGVIVMWGSELVKGEPARRLAGNPTSNQEPAMTRSTSTTNTTPKTAMGSGIAPPRLSNDPRSSSRNQSSFRKEPVVLNIEPAVLLGVARQLPMSIPK